MISEEVAKKLEKFLLSKVRYAVSGKKPRAFTRGEAMKACAEDQIEKACFGSLFDRAANVGLVTPVGKKWQVNPEYFKKRS